MLFWNRKRKSPKCMEINAAIIPKSCDIKEAYNCITVKKKKCSQFVCLFYFFCVRYVLFFFSQSMLLFCELLWIQCVLVIFFFFYICLLSSVEKCSHCHPVG